MSGDPYIMNVFPKASQGNIRHQEFIQVSTTPGNQTAMPVVFDINNEGRNRVHITPQIRTGDTAILTILTNEETGIPHFHRDADPDNLIEITVIVGNHVAIVRVIIKFDESMINFTTALQEQIGTGWENISALPRLQFISNPTGYRFHTNLTLLGQPINNPPQIQGLPQGSSPNDIVLINPAGLIEIPDIEIPGFLDEVYQFQISVYFAPLQRTFITFFNLVIAD